MLEGMVPILIKKIGFVQSGAERPLGFLEDFLKGEVVVMNQPLPFVALLKEGVKV